MERELGSQIVKNPFDPSNRPGAKVNRLDDDSYDRPMMNPEAPDPPSSSSGAGPSSGGQAGGSKGAPDYAALLQYLQSYQKQMEDKQK